MSAGCWYSCTES